MVEGAGSPLCADGREYYSISSQFIILSFVNWLLPVCDIRGETSTRYEGDLIPSMWDSWLNLASLSCLGASTDKGRPGQMLGHVPGGASLRTITGLPLLQCPGNYPTKAMMTSLGVFLPCLPPDCFGGHKNCPCWETGTVLGPSLLYMLPLLATKLVFLHLRHLEAFVNEMGQILYLLVCITFLSNP